MSKIKRNDPCHCGSGKKYKKCCYEKDQRLQVRRKYFTPSFEKHFNKQRVAKMFENVKVINSKSSTCSNEESKISDFFQSTKSETKKQNP